MKKKINIHKILKRLESVLETTGIYPQSVVGGKNAYKERNDYQNGWNACMMEMTERIGKALFEKQKKEDPDITMLMLADVMHEDHGHFALNMSDTFYYACADYEEVKKNEIEEVARLFRFYGYAGVTYWVAEKRKHDPVIPEYEKEVKYVRQREKEIADKISSRKDPSEPKNCYLGFYLIGLVIALFIFAFVYGGAGFKYAIGWFG